MKIPKKFKLFAANIDVEFDNKRMNDKSSYGLSDYSRLTITLSDVDGTEKLSDDRIMDCFYHEKVHMILNQMRERELTQNEQFVDVFAKLLRQSDETAEY